MQIGCDYREFKPQFVDRLEPSMVMNICITIIEFQITVQRQRERF